MKLVLALLLLAPTAYASDKDVKHTNPVTIVCKGDALKVDNFTIYPTCSIPSTETSKVDKTER